jgi:hypothetical protein
MIDTWVTVLILLSSFNGGPEVKQLSGYSEIVIKGCIAVILGVNRKIMGDLTVSFCWVEGNIDIFDELFAFLLEVNSSW